MSHRYCAYVQVSLCAVAAVLMLAPAASYGGYTAPTDEVPSPEYDSGEIYNTNYTYDGLDRRIRTQNCSLASPTVPPPLPGFAIDSFFDIWWAAEISLDDGLTYELWSGITPMRVTMDAQPPSGPVRVIDTEIISMEQVSSINPLHMIRENPDLDSPGQITVTDIGGGLYHIDSFFDVFTELTLDGGGTWEPANLSYRLNGLPEPGTLSLLALGALAVMRRRRK